MKTRTVLTVAAAAGLLVTTAACGSGEGNSAASDSQGSGQYDLLNKGNLSVGTNSANKPMSYVSKGKWAGYDIELMNEIAKGLGLKAKYTGSEFAPLLSGVSNHRYDLGIASASITCDRKKNLDFALPTYVGKINVMSNRDSGIKNLKQLKGKRLGVQTASIQVDYAKKHFQGVKLVQFPTFDAILTAMKGGQIDAAFIDGGRANTYKKQVGGDVTTVAAIPVPEMPAAIFLPKSSDALRKAVNQQIRKLVKNGTYKKLYLRHYEPPVPKLPLNFKLKCD